MVRPCHVTNQYSNEFGVSIIKVKEPEICPAIVAVKDVMKKEKTSFELLFDFRFLIDADCRGDARMKRHVI